MARFYVINPQDCSANGPCQLRVFDRQGGRLLWERDYQTHNAAVLAMRQGGSVPSEVCMAMLVMRSESLA